MIDSNIKIIFFGTAEFAVPVLEALLEAGFDVTAVVTQPDKPTGRKQTLTPPPIKLAAQKLGLNVLQPEKLKNDPALVSGLSDLGADVGVVAAYGKLIPPAIFNLPRHGVVVVHPSLLPKYRGPSPVQTAILKGEKETGVTIMKIDEELDHGPVISSAKYKIGENYLFSKINREIWGLGAKLLVKTLPDYIDGNIKPTPQNHAQATFTKMLIKEDGEIKWHQEAREIYNQFRAFHVWPGIWTRWQPANRRKVLKISDCRINAGQPYHDHEERYIGVVFQENEVVYIPCKIGHLEILRVQPEGGKEMDIKDFLAGHKNFIGSVLE